MTGSDSESGEDWRGGMEEEQLASISEALGPLPRTVHRHIHDGC